MTGPHGLTALDEATALPPGTDAVLPLPDLVRNGPFAQVLEAVAPGTGVRTSGEDAAAGTLLRSGAVTRRVLPRPARPLATERRACRGGRSPSRRQGPSVAGTR
jgi:hypothetical protein